MANKKKSKVKKACKGKNCNKLIPKDNLNRRVINAASFGTSIQQSPGNNNDVLFNLVNMLNRNNETKLNDITQNLGLVNQSIGTNQRDISNRINRSTADIGNRITANQRDIIDKSDNIYNRLSDNHREILRKTADEAKRLRDVYAGRSVQMRQFIDNKFNRINQKLDDTDAYNRENFTLIEPVLNRATFPQGRPPADKQALQDQLMKNARNVLNSRLFKAGVFAGESAVSAASTIGRMASSEAPF